MQHWFADPLLVYLIGLAAQMLFSARLIVQWVLSERARQVLTPEIFWQLSLLASFLLFVYGWMRDDFAIMLGQIINYFIYIRNMQIQGTWIRLPRALRASLLLFPLLVLTYSYHNGQSDVARLFDNEEISKWLLAWGIMGQIVFVFRFVYQWLYTERAKHSQLPGGFWLLSLTGSLMIISYALLRHDPILLAGQLFGSVIYIRNLMIGRSDPTPKES
jgi:lipid-A-disaccharide synthase-like uncharacterized protein